MYMDRIGARGGGRGEAGWTGGANLGAGTAKVKCENGARDAPRPTFKRDRPRISGEPAKAAFQGLKRPSRMRSGEDCRANSACSLAKNARLGGTVRLYAGAYGGLCVHTAMPWHAFHQHENSGSGRKGCLRLCRRCCCCSAGWHVRPAGPFQPGRAGRWSACGRGARVRGTTGSPLALAGRFGADGCARGLLGGDPFGQD